MIKKIINYYRNKKILNRYNNLNEKFTQEYYQLQKLISQGKYVEVENIINKRKATVKALKKLLRMML